MKRRDFLKTAGVLAAGTALSGQTSSAKAFMGLSESTGDDLNSINLPIRPLRADVDKPVSVIIIGAGSRTTTCPRWCLKAE